MNFKFMLKINRIHEVVLYKNGILSYKSYNYILFYKNIENNVNK